MVWRISGDAGNGLSIGSDGGAYSTTAGTPPPDAGRKTVAGLPAFFFSAHTSGSLMHPYGSPRGVEHAIANGIDVVDNWATAASDGIAVWTPYNEGTALGTYTTSESGAGMSSITSAEAAGLLSDAGNPYTPVSQRSDAPTADKPTGRDENWYGWLAATWHLRLVAEQLRVINARAVTTLRCNGTIDAPAAIQAVTRANAAASTIIYVWPSNTAQVALITAAGIAAGVNVDRDTTVTPATVTASGATWVFIYWMQDDARIASFVSAGLNVVLVTDSTHYQTTRAQTLGCRGVMCSDPVYARGALGTPAALQYRKTSQNWDSKGTRYGMITRRTSDYRIVDGRGVTINGIAGIGLTPEFQWVDGSTPVAYAQMLVGEMCPIAEPTSYVIDWSLNIRGSQPTQNFCKAGVFFGFADDRDFAILSAGTAQPGINGYHAFVRPGNGSLGGQLVIGKLTNGGYTELAVSPNRINWSPNSWGALRLTVTPAQVQLQRIQSGSVTQTVTAADPDYRGPYFKISKEEADGAGGTFQEFTDNWVLTDT